jgi:hypothetical protein
MSATSSKDTVAERVASGEKRAEGVLIRPRLPKSEARVFVDARTKKKNRGGLTLFERKIFSPPI